MRAPRIRQTPRRGITLVETVIALAMIGVILAAAASLMLSSVKAENRALDELHLAATAENAVECFRYAKDADELFAALLATDPDFVKAGEAFLLYRGSCKITVSADFATNTIDIVAADRRGEEIYRISYEKGVQA